MFMIYEGNPYLMSLKVESSATLVALLCAILLKMLSLKAFIYLLALKLLALEHCLHG